MSVATRTGDEGQTSLIFGKRVPKDHPRVVTYGAVDELNSALGVARAHCQNEEHRAFILATQWELVELMGELAADDSDQDRYLAKAKQPISEAHLARLDEAITRLEAVKGGFQGWIMPGENPTHAFFDVARTTCRRAERMAFTLLQSGSTVRPIVLQYLNRLADVMWLMGREAIGPK